MTELTIYKRCLTCKMLYEPHRDNKGKMINTHFCIKCLGERLI